MKRNEKWQQMLKEERLPHQLRVQSRQIDNVLQHRQMAGQVSGGTITQKTIHFNLQTHLSSGLEKLRELKQDFLDALGVPDIKVERKDGQWQLHVSRPEEAPVPLLELLPLVPDIEPSTAVLGLSEEGMPIVLNLTHDDFSHMLIMGDSRAGKTALLRALAISFALTNKQSQLQLLVIDAVDHHQQNGATSLEPLSYLPHLLEPVVRNEEMASELLNFLVQEITYRSQAQVKAPVIVVMIDDLVSLLEKTGEHGRDALIKLVQNGQNAGIHLIATTRQPESALISGVFKSSIPVRVVGRIESVEAGLAATGDSDLHPDYFWGEGDFAVMTSAGTQYFQAAFIGDYDLHLTIETLHRHRPRPLLAQLFDQRQAAIFDSPLQTPSIINDALHFSPEGEIEQPVEKKIEKPSPKGKPFIINVAKNEDAMDDEIPFDAGRGWDLIGE